MKKYFYIMSAAALAMASCSEEQELVNAPASQENRVLTATFEQDAATRTNIAAADNALTWSEDDAIAVFGESAIKYNLSEAATGTFVIEDRANAPENITGAAFPYATDVALSNNTLTMTLPTTIDQTTAGELDLPMWGTVTDGDIAFKHLAGVLKVNLTNLPESYTKLIVTASNPISGTFTAATTETTPVLASTSTNEADKTVTVSFTNTTATTLYLPLPVGTYASIVVSVSNGTEAITLKNWTNKEVKRAKVYATSASTVWDGKTVRKVADTDEAGSRVLYEVSHAEELAWVLRNWNGGSTSATRPTTIKLLNDIDFGGYDIYFDLAGTSISFHSVTLDGNNHTIKNYKVAGVSTGGSGLKAGLLPSTSGVTVKDLTIDNAIIGSDQTSQDLYAGALIGIATDQAPTPYTTVIENVTVQNSSISGVNKVGGLIGQANGIHTVSGTVVKNTTITGCGTDAGSLGGLYGYLKVEGESSFINSKMTGGSIVCEQGEDKASRGSSGFIGTLGMSMANSSLTLTGCSVSETDLDKSNTKNPFNAFIGAIRSGTAATLTINGENVSF